MEIESPAILALHGNLGSHADWDVLELPHLRSIDLWQYSDLDFFEMAHLLATDLSIGMERPILAGYSLGGRLALHAMAIHPERWGGAIILSAHPGLKEREERDARRATDAEWASRARSLPWRKFLAKWNAQAVFADSPIFEATSEGQTLLEARRDEIALAFETWSLGRQGDLRSQLRRFDAPVLWITGEADRKFTDLGAEMGDVFSNFQHRVLSGLGHRVIGAAAKAVIERFRADCG